MGANHEDFLSAMGMSRQEQDEAWIRATVGAKIDQINRAKKTAEGFDYKEDTEDDK